MDICSVSEITKYIKNLMERDRVLPKLMIRGEISNFKQYASGHCYFTLKDAGAALKAVLFRSRAQQLKFVPTNGMKIVAAGTISVYERDGVYQLYADALFPEGAGELSVAFEQLKAKLTAEGLFEPAHKKKLPYFPAVIGIITSSSGAVLRDIYRVAKRRNPNVKLVLYPVQVQGEQSAGQIVRAMKFFNKAYPVDLLIVGRGGGSVEDLWSFNEEAVVRAIFASHIPVISAVGHETDYTLADFVSDVRAATPSQAAELAVPDVRELKRYVYSLRAQLMAKSQRTLQAKRGRLSACLQSAALQSPQLLLAAKRQRLDYISERFQKLTQQAVREKKYRMQVALEKLTVLNPAAVLQRGYAIVQAKKRIVRGISEVKSGASIQVMLADGSFTAVVGEVREEKKNGKSEEIII